MRGPYHSQTADGNNGNIFFVRNKRFHNQRRKAWDKAFGRVALETYAPRIHELTSILLRQLQLRTGVSVDGAQIARWYAFDVIGEVGLGKSYEQLEKMEMHPAVNVLVKGAWYFGVPGHMPWALRILSSIPGGGGALSAFQDWCQRQMEEKLKVCSSIFTGSNCLWWTPTNVLRAERFVVDTYLRETTGCDYIFTAG